MRPSHVPGFGGFGARMKKGDDLIFLYSFYITPAPVRLEVGLELEPPYIVVLIGLA
jgi:hypothetical protein